MYREGRPGGARARFSNHGVFKMNAFKRTADCRTPGWACLLNGVANAAQWVARVALVSMTLIIGWQVFARFVLNDSPSWSETTAILLMGWFILIGAAAGVRHQDHIGFVVGQMMMPGPLRRAVRSFSHLLTAAFGIAMAYFGMDLVIGSWHVLMPGSYVVQGATYIPLVLGGVLIAVFSLENLLRQAPEDGFGEGE